MKIISFFRSRKKIIKFVPFLLIPSVAFADGGQSPVGEGISYLINQMYGADGVAIATVAVMGVGLLCLMHVLEWKRLMQTLIGISFIFGAGALVSAIQSVVSNT